MNRPEDGTLSVVVCVLHAVTTFRPASITFYCIYTVLPYNKTLSGNRTNNIFARINTHTGRPCMSATLLFSGVFSFVGHTDGINIAMFSSIACSILCFLFTP